MPYQIRTCVVCKSKYRGYHNSLTCSRECRLKSRCWAVAGSDRGGGSSNTLAKAITVKLTAIEHARIKALATVQGREMAALIRDAMRSAGLLGDRPIDNPSPGSARSSSPPRPSRR